MRSLIYVDTSVIGGCFDEEFAEWSNILFDEFVSGEKIAVVSDITYRELELAPDYVNQKLNDISNKYRKEVYTGREVEELAENYIKEGVISESYYEDALHIALATIIEVTALASWNFKHIVNLEKIYKYNGVNLKNGYSILEIRSPREIIKPKDYE